MAQTILIVDDSRMFRRRIRKALEDAGHHVIEAGDGLEALEKLTGTLPALIICDLNMPRMNGLEFLEELQRRSDLDIPIIMLTAEVQPSTINQAKRLGAKGWLVKPVSPPALLNLVTHIAQGQG